MKVNRDKYILINIITVCVLPYYVFQIQMSEETTNILDQVGGFNYTPRGIVHLKVIFKGILQEVQCFNCRKTATVRPIH